MPFILPWSPVGGAVLGGAVLGGAGGRGREAESKLSLGQDKVDELLVYLGETPALVT